MLAVQVSWHLDAERRPPARLLDAWPTLAAAAAAAAGPGIEIAVVQAASQDATLERDGVRFEFVRAAQGGRLRRRLGPWASPIDRRILDRIASLRPDVLHQHGLTHPLHARALTVAFPHTPVLVQDHASRPPRRLRRLHRRGYRDIAAVAFTARAQAKPFLACGALPPHVRVLELLEGSTGFTPGDAAKARARTGVAGSPCLLWLGHLDANKDPLTVLRAFAAVARPLPEARLWLAFRGETLRPDVDAFIAANGLGERVTLLGAVDHAHVELLLRAADVLVQASAFEGSGYAVIEALACGATPVVTDIPSFRRITRDGEVGALFPPGDAKALAAALTRLAAEDAAGLRVAARAHFERYLSFDVLGAELRAAYAGLAAHA